MCYVASTESTLRVRMGTKLVSTWYQIEKFIQRYEPTSIKAIFLPILDKLPVPVEEVVEGSFLEAILQIPEKQSDFEPLTFE